MERYLEDLKKEFENLSSYHSLLLSRARLICKDMDILLKEMERYGLR
jgi:hypothetical protein